MKRRPEWLCNNWGCPARRSCARHFGRSDHYRAMTEPKDVRTPTVDEGEEDCEHYQRDGFKEWLVLDLNGREHLDTPPGWMIV